MNFSSNEIKRLEIVWFWKLFECQFKFAIVKTKNGFVLFREVLVKTSEVKA